MQNLVGHGSYLKLVMARLRAFTPFGLLPVSTQCNVHEIHPTCNAFLTAPPYVQPLPIEYGASERNRTVNLVHGKDAL